MSNASWYRSIARNRYWILVWCLCWFGAALYYVASNKPLFQSTVQLYVDEPPLVSELFPSSGMGPTNGVRRLYHEAGSSAIMEHLIAKFELGKHYGIPEGTPFRKERIMHRLDRRIDVKVLDPNSLSITVKDVDRNVAAGMANAVYRELVRISEQRATGDLGRSKRHFATVMKQMEQRARKDEARMRALLDSAVTALATAGDAGTLGLDLLALSSRMGASNQEMSFTRRTDQLTAALAQKEPLTRLVLIRKATRDLDTDPLFLALLTVLMMTLLPVFLLLAGIIAWDRNGAYVIAELHALVGSAMPDGPVGTSNTNGHNGLAADRITAPFGGTRTSPLTSLPVQGPQQGRPEEHRHFAVVEEVVEEGMDQVGDKR